MKYYLICFLIVYSCHGVKTNMKSKGIVKETIFEDGDTEGTTHRYDTSHPTLPLQVINTDSLKRKDTVRTTVFVEEEQTKKRTYRGPNPDPPSLPWWTIDTDSLIGYQPIVWKYLKDIYPIEEDNPKGYQIYALKNEPDDLKGSMAHLDKFHTFFREHLLSKVYFDSSRSNSAMKLNRTFFDEAMGEPTCTIEKLERNTVIYKYFIRTKYRQGSCPTFLSNQDDYCAIDQLNYCACLIVSFSLSDGEIKGVSFIRCTILSIH